MKGSVLNIVRFDGFFSIKPYKTSSTFTKFAHSKQFQNSFEWANLVNALLVLYVFSGVYRTKFSCTVFKERFI